MMDSAVPHSHEDDDYTMQKRRHQKDTQLLPVTSDDTTLFAKRQKRTVPPLGERRSVYLCGTTTATSAVVGVILLILVLFVGHNLTGSVRSTSESRSIVIGHQAIPSLEPLPLAHFDTLNRALEHSSLVGLYYAASWCPMSTPATELLTEHFASVPNLLYMDNALPQKHSLAIVHVSSDTSESSMQKYTQDRKWIPVPFASEERTALKKHFQVCAKRELQELGIDRKFEIPTLIILDGETHGVITMNGVQDLEEHGAQALDHWIELQQVIRGLESKYQR